MIYWKNGVKYEINTNGFKHQRLQNRQTNYKKLRQWNVLNTKNRNDK